MRPIISQMPPPRWLTDELELGQLLEHAAHDQPGDRQGAIHRTPDA
jgi:hypothetical protein